MSGYNSGVCQFSLMYYFFTIFICFVLFCIYGSLCQILNNTSPLSELELRQLRNMDTYIEYVYDNPSRNISANLFATLEKYSEKLKNYVTKIESGNEDIIKACTNLNDNEGPEFLKIGVNQKTFKEEMGWTDEDVEFYNNVLDGAELSWQRVRLLINNLDPYTQNITLKYEW